MGIVYTIHAISEKSLDAVLKALESFSITKDKLALVQFIQEAYPDFADGSSRSYLFDEIEEFKDDGNEFTTTQFINSSLLPLLTDKSWDIDKAHRDFLALLIVACPQGLSIKSFLELAPVDFELPQWITEGLDSGIFGFWRPDGEIIRGMVNDFLTIPDGATLYHLAKSPSLHSNETLLQKIFGLFSSRVGKSELQRAFENLKEELEEDDPNDEYLCANWLTIKDAVDHAITHNLLLGIFWG